MKMSEYIGKRYEVRKLIGKGGMADVYLAWDTILNREVAIKVLKSEMADDPIALERFKREAGASTQLSHPNIVDVYDVGDDGDKHYIVMEYVKGYTLKQLIRKRGAIPYKESVWVMKQLAGALMEAHRKGIIHRDVKTQNVLIKDDGTVKMADFGIALANGAISITHKDSILGSVHYLAPELTKGEQASMQSDIYSLGIVFFELLTGDVPYKAENAIQVALQHVKGTIPSVRSFDPGIPQSVENIIIKATAKSPENRYKNVALMLKDLNECLRSAHKDDPKIDLNDENEKKASETVHVSDTVKKKPKKKKSAFSAIFLVFATLLSILILLVVLLLTGVIGGANKRIAMPDITNMTVQAAKDKLAEYNLELDDSRISWELTDEVEKDLIVSSSPNAEEEVEKGAKIRVTVSLGTYSILKDYKGFDYRDAEEELKRLNFIVKRNPVASDDVEAGKIISQSMEPGTKYNPEINNEITLNYSQDTSFQIPLELLGKSIEDVIDYFNEEGIEFELQPQPVSEFTDEETKESKPNTLIRTDPELGSYYNQKDNIKVKIYYYEGD